MMSALVLFALIAHASAQCGDDMVPIVVGKLPAEWNVGTIPHLFLNSEHLRGVASVKDFKITGLDTVEASLQFCPVNMTIYGELSAKGVQMAGTYTSNLDYLTKGTELFAHGQGFLNMTLVNFRLKNLVAPLRYSRVVKKLQIENMEYDASEDIVSPQITGYHVDGENGHEVMPEESVAIDRSTSTPTVIEFVRAIINSRSKDKILLNAVREMFSSAATL